MLHVPGESYKEYVAQYKEFLCHVGSQIRDKEDGPLIQLLYEIRATGDEAL